MQHKFTSDQALSDAVTTFMLATCIAILFGIENVVPIFATQLGLVHGLICLAQQLVGVDIFCLRVKSQTNTCRNLQEQIPQHHRTGCCIQQSSERWHAVHTVIEVDQHRNKLISPQPCQGIAVSQRIFHASRQRDQQMVTSGMPMRVINSLESV